MTLTGSGLLRFSDINVELGRSSTALISLDSASNGSYATINTNSPNRPSGTNPDSVSEWYSYNHNATPCYSYQVRTISGMNDCISLPYNTTRYSNCDPLSAAAACYFYTDSACTSLNYPPMTSYYQTLEGENVEYNYLAQITNVAPAPC